MRENEARDIISSRLQPGEKLVWYGTPTPLIAAAQYFALLLFLTITVASAARELIDQLIAAKIDWHLPNLSVVPVLLSLSLFGLWMWTVERVARCWRTAYGLTDRRILIAAGKTGAVASYNAAALADMKFTGSESRGSIVFNYGWLPWWRRQFRGYKTGLYGIRNPGRIHSLIYETLILPKKERASV